MHDGFGARLDARIAGLIVLRLRRERPLLRLVPATWLLPIAIGAVRRSRRSLARGAIRVALPTVVLIVLVIVAA